MISLSVAVTYNAAAAVAIVINCQTVSCETKENEEIVLYKISSYVWRTVWQDVKETARTNTNTVKNIIVKKSIQRKRYEE